MPSKIQLAERAIEEERARFEGTRPDSAAAVFVVMRLQQREEQLLALLAAALEREATLADQLGDSLRTGGATA